MSEQAGNNILRDSSSYEFWRDDENEKEEEEAMRMISAAPSQAEGILGIVPTY